MIQGRFIRALVGTAALAVFVSLGPLRARVPCARAAEPEDTMQCDRAGEPGRVRCTVEIRASEGLASSWAEVEIITVPEFAAPLRGRLGPLEAASKEPSYTRFTRRAPA